MSVREAYQKQMEARINECSARIDVLKFKADRTAVDKQIEVREYFASLQKGKRRVREKLARLSKSSELEWKQYKEEVDHAWDELKNAVEYLGEKIQ